MDCSSNCVRGALLCCAGMLRAAQGFHLRGLLTLLGEKAKRLHLPDPQVTPPPFLPTPPLSAHCYVLLCSCILYVHVWPWNIPKLDTVAALNFGPRILNPYLHPRKMLLLDPENQKRRTNI